MDSRNKMVFNTIILYANLIITIAVNLYATRLILNALGVVDYGIVNLISGIVAMFAFIQNSMTVSTQRYLSVNLGRGDNDNQNKIFNSSLALHLFIAIVLVIILELCLPLIFNSSVQIPDERIDAAKILYHLTVLGTVLMIIVVPYGATLNAHENMSVYALISIAETTARLVGAIILLSYSSDRLIFYGLIIVFIRLLNLGFTAIYSRKKYYETKFNYTQIKLPLIKEMFFFSIWNTFGSLAITCRLQGVAIVMNTFLGVVVNAAFGIANQVAGQLANFASTINKAMAPQIMQREGAGNIESMRNLSLMQCRYSSFLLSYIAIPLFITMPYVLQIWLKEVPENSVGFCQFMLLVSVVQQMTIGLQSAIQAKGNIRNYQIVVSTFLMLNIPLAYILLKAGLSSYIVIIGMLCIEILCVFIRMFFAQRLVGITYSMFIKDVILPVLVIYLVSGPFILILNKKLFSSVTDFSHFSGSVALSITIITVTIALLMSKDEKTMLKEITSKLLRR